MSLVATAVCPHPPMIVPEIAGAAAPELDDLRRACDAAVVQLLAAAPDLVLVLGTAAATGSPPAPHHGTFRRWGSSVGFSLGDHGTARAVPPLPLSLLVGGWLLARHDLKGLTVGMETVGAAVGAGDCAAVGAALTDRSPRVALLVMGDGSACRGEKAPGYADPRARAYDDGVARALADADADALLSLDSGLSAQLAVAGRAPWQALAGAVRATGVSWRGELSYYAAPYGVAYFVATWAPGAVGPAAGDGGSSA